VAIAEWLSTFGAGGDVAVHIGAKGFGNATDRQNMIYGVYRAGTWLIGSSPVVTVQFGAVGDIPLVRGAH
jgi:hypothetical protein